MEDKARRGGEEENGRKGEGEKGRKGEGDRIPFFLYPISII